ncbi:hypothetical protein ABH942_002314 [Flavobacterium sp. 28YEA47A]|uniref:hypothetical protein n=1 Tax=Flavobacterium sp. 28YEA47A TaxID=3156276 RepID=UPI003515C58D
MKKTALFLILSLAMIGCEGKKKETPSENSVQKTQERNTMTVVSTDCKNDPIIKFLSSMYYSERANWLSEYGEAICKYNLYSCIEDFHSIPDTIFTKLARQHLRNSSGIKLYELPWQDLEDFIKKEGIKCYDAYIAFDIDTINNKASLRKTPFSTTEATYSIPLFEGIKKEHKNIQTIYVTEAIVGYKEKKGIVNKERIIFKVKDTSGGYFHYDISDDPAKKTRILPKK